MGSPDLNIPHNLPLIATEDLEAVNATLTSGWIAQGKAVSSLESFFVEKYAQGFSCALSSGTSALFLALKGLGIKTGDRVAIPTYACSAILNAVYMLQAKPVLVDVLPDTFCLDPQGLNEVQDISAVVAVHTFGAKADVQKMIDSHVVVEDCCQSVWGADNESLLGMVGSAAVFSFYATKIITGGQGGLVWSRDESLLNTVKDYRQFDGRTFYEPRFNFQMSDIQASLIVSQFKRFETITRRRQFIARQYLDALPIGLSFQKGADKTGAVLQRFVVIAPNVSIRDRFQKHMLDGGVNCIVPIMRFELLHNYLKLDPQQYPVAENIADRTLSLPIYPALTDAQVKLISNCIKNFKI
ncbi:MAG: DegT/DnrJ/EryC1/StrS family aminotransferase [Polynucleobacter sp.]